MTDPGTTYRVEGLGPQNSGVAEAEAVPDEFGWRATAYVKNRYEEVREIPIVDGVSKEGAMNAAARWIARVPMDRPVGLIGAGKNPRGRNR